MTTGKELTDDDRAYVLSIIPERIYSNMEAESHHRDLGIWLCDHGYIHSSSFVRHFPDDLEELKVWQPGS